VKGSDAAQFLTWVTHVLDQTAGRGDRIGNVLIENRMKNLFLALEVEINRAVRDVGGARDVGDFGVEIPVSREDAGGSPQN
jgi:hypothetical protein